MKLKTLFQIAAAAGGLSASVAAAQNAPAEVTVPINGGYSSGQVVYDHSGGMHTTGYTGEFTPPARFPVERIPVQYLRYYPARWYGTPGSTLRSIAPQVHMPTDTTQLGFYSQRVPTWMPVPGMIPGPPNPANYHSYRPMAYQAGAYGGGVVTSERVVNSQSTGAASTRTTPTTPAQPRHSVSGTTSGSTDVPPMPSDSGTESELPLQPPPAPDASAGE